MINHTFAGKKPDEQVHYFLRQHWVEPFKTLLFFAVLLLVPAALWWAMMTGIPEALATPWVRVSAVLGTSLYVLYCMALFLQTFLDYFLDTWTITSERIISSERENLFKHVTTEIRLHRVQDVTVEVHGFLDTLLHAGTIIIQTAGEEGRISLENIEEPQEVAKKIMELADAVKAHEPAI